jgi:hypothetical protein
VTLTIQTQHSCAVSSHINQNTRRQIAKYCSLQNHRYCELQYDSFQTPNPLNVSILSLNWLFPPPFSKCPFTSYHLERYVNVNPCYSWKIHHTTYHFKKWDGYNVFYFSSHNVQLSAIKSIFQARRLLFFFFKFISQFFLLMADYDGRDGQDLKICWMWIHTYNLRCPSVHHTVYLGR